MMLFLEERLGRIVNELKGCIRQDSIGLNNLKIKYGNFKGGEKVGLDTSDWNIFGKEDRWGGKDVHCWFRFEFEIPEEFKGKFVSLEISTGREGEWDALNPQFLVYVNERLIQGLDVNHRDITLTESANPGEVFNIALYSYSGMKSGRVELDAQISTLSRAVEKLYYDISVPLNAALLLHKEDKKRIDIIKHINAAANLLDLRKPYTQEFNTSIATATEYLDKEFYGKYCGNSEAVAWCVGHTHIDVAWLWTLAQTREKAVRSFSTVLNLMKEYPDYVFMSSQPQLYKYIKEDQPELFEEIRVRVAEGRWEPEGAMWLEADCNLTSGESLVRQLLYGKRFFEKEFGKKNRVLWLPDVFGYSAALPQILKKSGIDYFVTSKISWNEYNKMPYDTFTWEGVDGTGILTHFITTCDITGKDWSEAPNMTTYNGYIKPSEILGAWARYQQKHISDEVLVPFGFGDGGGGPTKDMLENAKRLEKGIPGMPRVKMGKTLDFLQQLEENTASDKNLPRWVGELYLEYHRGTYTSMARNKKFNRKSELLYQDAEFLSVAGNLLTNAAYPSETLYEGWETILLNQFHDILPGSSIKEVYEDSRVQYMNVLKNGQAIVDAAIDSIADNIALERTSLVVFNQLDFVRSDTAEFELPEGYCNASVLDTDGKHVISQLAEGNKLVFHAKGIPAKGYKTYLLEKSALENAASRMKISQEGMSNRFFDIAFDSDMNMASIYDKVNMRELLKPGEKANVLQAFEDKPYNYDAWDINIYYQEKMWEVSKVDCIEVIEAGPVRASIRIRRSFLDSTIEQEIVIYADMPRIDFVNMIDWKETQVLLKAAFPVDIHAQKATYEIQYGNVERPTHWNTSWDQARFEVCAHKWADLSEDGYGVSLMNDCKYGYDIKDGVMRLTLLKSAKDPNVDADREMHRFTYSLYPHKGDFREAGTVKSAYSLNCPLYAKVEGPHPGLLPESMSLVGTDAVNVFIEVVKKAEDTDDVIIRLYECHNRRTPVRLTFFKKLANVWECDLMEKDLSGLAHEENHFDFEIKPYEIKTFKLRV